MHEALDKLAHTDRLAADFVKLHYFVGLTVPEAAEALGVSPRTADRLWAYARTWLRAEIEPGASAEARSEVAGARTARPREPAERARSNPRTSRPHPGREGRAVRIG